MFRAKYREREKNVNSEREKYFCHTTKKTTPFVNVFFVFLLILHDIPLRAMIDSNGDLILIYLLQL